MAATLITPRLQILTDDGLPLSGGLIYLFEASTSTPLASYTDDTEATANAHPVVLDSAGRADIWLSTTSLYKVTVKDSDDNLIYTTDNVSGAGGTISSLITAGANIDMDGYSIVTNINKDLPITPHGTGKVQITNLELQTNLDMNGNDIAVDDLDAIVASTTLENILMFGSTASAVNYVKLSNAATGDPVLLDVLGTDTNIGVTLLTKGTGTVNVSGTANYEQALISDDNLVNKKYVDDIILTNVEVLTPEKLGDSTTACGSWGVVTFSGSTPTLGGSYNVTSITDTGVGDIKINYTNQAAAGATTVSCADDNSVGSRTDAGQTTYAEIGLYDIDGAAAIDTNFSFITVGGIL